MNRVISILGLIVIAGFITPDLSRAHSHLLALPQSARQSLIPAEPAEFIRPVLRSENLSQGAGQPPWNGFSLTHTDTQYLPGSARHHSNSYRSFNTLDGAALMFSWPFTSVPIFLMSPQESSDAPALKQGARR